MTSPLRLPIPAASQGSLDIRSIEVGQIGNGCCARDRAHNAGRESVSRLPIDGQIGFDEAFKPSLQLLQEARRIRITQRIYNGSPIEYLARYSRTAGATGAVSASADSNRASKNGKSEDSRPLLACCESCSPSISIFSGSVAPSRSNVASNRARRRFSPDDASKSFASTSDGKRELERST